MEHFPYKACLNGHTVHYTIKNRNIVLHAGERAEAMADTPGMRIEFQTPGHTKLYLQSLRHENKKKRKLRTHA